MKSTLFLTTLAPLLIVDLAACGICVEQTVGLLPEGWQQTGDALSPSQPVRFSIALRQPRIHGLRSKIASSKDRHLSLDETRALRAPDPQDVGHVLQWLADNDIADATPQDDWIHVQTTVDKAEPLLDMKLRSYAFEDKPPVLRTRQYSVPESLSRAISFVHPIANFMRPEHEVMPSPPLTAEKFTQEGADDGAVCVGGVTPSCITKLYNMSYSVPDNSSQIIFGVAGFLEQNANHNDVSRFLNLTAPDVASSGRSFAVELVNGGENSEDPRQSGIEAALDVEYAMALGFPANVVFYATGGRGVMLDDSGKPVEGPGNDNEPYLDLIQYLLDKPDGQVPHVLSVSYADDELSVPRQYAERVCSMLGLLTARGTTIVFASGDGGARGGRASSCRANDGTNREVTMATFPGTCPWVTVVGGVTNGAEPPAGAAFSTGGFSQIFAREPWQDAAVESYVEALEGHLEGYYNASMRAIPDISAVSTRFLTIVNSQRTPVQGTSASAPVFASMIALINDARVRQGKKALGWVNELLYSDKVQAVLQDITQGQSIACPFNGTQGAGGWPAKKGWDAMTGLGIPKEFDKFMQVLLEA